METTDSLKIENLNLAIMDGGDNDLVNIISHLNFSLLRGQCVALVGESGSGKSMTAASILQLLPDAAVIEHNSHIIFNAVDLLDQTEAAMQRIRGKKIAIVFQDALSALNPVLTIGNQLQETLKKHATLNKTQQRARALQLLQDVGLQDGEALLANYPHQLSGGMRQRVMIAIALAAEPEILIADECTTALDVTLQQQILNLLIDLKQRYQLTLLFISHDLAVVEKIADQVVVLKAGKCVEQQPAQQFFQAPQSTYAQQLLQAADDTAVAFRQPQTSHEVLRVENLKVYFPIKKGVLKRTIGFVRAVDDVSFAVMRGQTLALVGESGSGKSTTANAILKLLPITAGNVIIEGQNIKNISGNRLKQLRKRLQIVFQDPYSSLNPRMMVFDILAEGLLEHRLLKNHDELEQTIDRLLDEVELTRASKWRYPHEFSGGQKQRIAIARALSLQPDIIILDEPTSALDVLIQEQILELLLRLQAQFSLSYLLITHNLNVVKKMADQVAIMYQGKIVERGTTVDIFNHPQHDYAKKLLAARPTLTRG